MHNLRQYTVPLQRYMALMDLQVSSSREYVSKDLWLMYI